MAGKVFFSVSMSLDGFIAPESLEDLMGQQWMELQQWIFPQRFFRENLKLGEGGEEGRDNDIVRETFERTGVSVMAKPHFPEGDAVMFVAGPGGPDKKTVLRIVADVGFESVDAGELKAARLLEPLAMLWIQLALTKGHGRDFAFVMARRDAANRIADPRVRMVHPHPQEAE